MEEEKKEVLEEQPVEEQPAEEQQGEKKPVDPNKTSLIAFILACCSFLFLGPIGVVCAIISLSFFKKTKGLEITAQPYVTFQKITKILATICLIVGIVITVAMLIGALIGLISLIITAIAGALSSLVIL